MLFSQLHRRIGSRPVQPDLSGRYRTGLPLCYGYQEAVRLLLLAVLHFVRYR